MKIHHNVAVVRYALLHKLNSKAFDIIGGSSLRKKLFNSKASRRFSLTA
jgi:hypothetical protein